MIIIDHGSSLNSDQLELTKAFGKFFSLNLDFLCSSNVPTFKIASNIISMLNERDQISILAVADQFTSHYIDPATPTEQHDVDRKPHRHQHTMTPARMYTASMDNKWHFLRFIDQLNGTKEITNHSLAFSSAFELLHEINANRRHQQSGSGLNGPLHMMYISRGLVSPLTEAPHVLQAIANGQRRADAPVIINTCAIVLGELITINMFQRLMITK